MSDKIKVVSEDSKTVRLMTPCGSLYTIGQFDTLGLKSILNEFSKSGNCKKTMFNAIAICLDGNIEAYRSITHIKKMIERNAIKFELAEDKDTVLDKLNRSLAKCSITEIGKNMLDHECGMDEVIENGVRCKCCVDAMGRNIQALVE